MVTGGPLLPPSPLGRSRPTVLDITALNFRGDPPRCPPGRHGRPPRARRATRRCGSTTCAAPDRRSPSSTGTARSTTRSASPTPPRPPDGRRGSAAQLAYDTGIRSTNDGRDAAASSWASRPSAAKRGSRPASRREALPGRVSRVRAGTSSMSLIARWTNCDCPAGVGGGDPPCHAEQRRHPLQGDVGPVGDVERRVDESMGVGRGVGEAEVVEDGDADEHVARRRRQALVTRRRHADLHRADEVAAPHVCQPPHQRAESGVIDVVESRTSPAQRVS